MFGLGSMHKIDVKDAMRQIKSLCVRGDQNDRKFMAKIAADIKRFIDDVISKRANEIHESKLKHLRDASKLLFDLSSNAKGPTTRERIDNNIYKVTQALQAYASEGSMYLLRHPDKIRPEKDMDPSKDTDKVISKETYEKRYGAYNLWHKRIEDRLSYLGVKEAKKVGELIEEEILLSPKPVLIKIFTSEMKRTDMFAKIIKHINSAKRLELKDEDLKIEGPGKDNALLMHKFEKSAEALAYKIMERYKDPVEGMFQAFYAWTQEREGFDKEIREGNIADPKTVYSALCEFMIRSEREIHATQDKYLIIIGIGHSWNIDTVLYTRTGIRDIISTAEYAKLEGRQLFYKGRWYAPPPGIF